MPESVSDDALLRVFRSIAANGVAAMSGSEPSLYRVLSDMADTMRRRGKSLECVVGRVKAMASEAGILETHDRIVSNAVRAAIGYYYRDDIQLMLSVTIETTQAFLARDNSTPTATSEQSAATPSASEMRPTLLTELARSTPRRTASVERARPLLLRGR